MKAVCWEGTNDIRVYGGFIDKVPLGAAFNKGVTLKMKMGQTHVMPFFRIDLCLFYA